MTDSAPPPHPVAAAIATLATNPTTLQHLIPQNNNEPKGNGQPMSAGLQKKKPYSPSTTQYLETFNAQPHRSVYFQQDFYRVHRHRKFPWDPTFYSSSPLLPNYVRDPQGPPDPYAVPPPSKVLPNGKPSLGPLMPVMQQSPMTPQSTPMMVQPDSQQMTPSTPPAPPSTVPSVAPPRRHLAPRAPPHPSNHRRKVAPPRGRAQPPTAHKA